MSAEFRGRRDFALQTAGSIEGRHRHFAECRLVDYLESFYYFNACPNRKVFAMIAPTVEALSAAARAGITVIRPDGSTTRVHGATASVGTSVIDVLYDPEHGTYDWIVDGIERNVDWVRWFFEME
ncbi:hypothetical protein DPV79_24325 [Burkholderia reimsis]|uniref:Uncharacterized protein n=1 Tax=Burkholderia reimsis TaxID=2234132 RepID=A0A365QQQ8_9BURK|nr:hypothetical protein DPV79_24325 [Burkholderia reimsis]